MSDLSESGPGFKAGPGGGPSSSEDMQLFGRVLLGPLICLAASGLALDADVVPTDHRALLDAPRSNESNSSVLAGISMVTFRWDHMEQRYMVALWTLAAGLCKMGR